MQNKQQQPREVTPDQLLDFLKPTGLPNFNGNTNIKVRPSGDDIDLLHEHIDHVEGQVKELKNKLVEANAATKKYYDLNEIGYRNLKNYFGDPKNKYLLMLINRTSLDSFSDFEKAYNFAVNNANLKPTM